MPHGFVLLDKPSGIGSTLALSRVRRALGGAKAGHLGTLDPLASGLLVIAVGDGCKRIKECNTTDKTYAFTVRFGVETATDDLEGLVTRTCPIVPNHADINAVTKDFSGKTIMQVPPLYSAVKTGGIAAHARARRGEMVTLEARPRTIYTLESLSYHPPYAEFQAQCSSGTYVRSLARDMAAALGTVAITTRIRRLAVGALGVDKAISFSEVLRGGVTLWDSDAVIDLLAGGDKKGNLPGNP
ncbi:MAG: tRNA pseudouridine(55) synthase TruB [Holosporales bacterium]|jgi:tRNA pseudouridine55 synthase